MTHSIVPFRTPNCVVTNYNPPELVNKSRSECCKLCFSRLRSAHRVCKDGEHQWKTHTLTFYHSLMIRQRLGSASTVRKREKCQSPLDFSCFVFLDGHGGSIVAKYASKHLHKFIIQRPEYPSDIPAALKQVSFHDDYQKVTLDLSTENISFRYF